MTHRKLLEGATWRLDGVGALVCIAMCAAGYFAGMRPLLEQHARFAAQQTQLNSQRAKAAESASHLLNTKKEQGAVHDWLAAHPLQLQSAQLANQRLAALTSVANQAGAALDDVRPGLVTPGVRYDTFPIRLSGSGSYATCAALLHRIRSTFPDMRIAALDITGRPTEPNAPAKFRCDLLWYTTLGSKTTAALDPSK
jgi:Tfp pilus assembly protein PilO